MSYRVNLRPDTEVALEEAFVDLRKEKRLAGALVRPAEEKGEVLSSHLDVGAGTRVRQRALAEVKVFKPL
jgi:hypothetical protein